MPATACAVPGPCPTCLLTATASILQQHQAFRSIHCALHSMHCLACLPQACDSLSQGPPWCLRELQSPEGTAIEHRKQGQNLPSTLASMPACLRLA